MNTTSTVIEGRDALSGRAIRIICAEGLIQEITDAKEHSDLPLICAGLVDLQINGFAGQDLNSDRLDVAAVSAMTASLRTVGVTTFLPTLITASRQQISERLSIIAAARMQDPDVAHAIVGVHLEGPYISAEDGPRGAHPLQYVRAPDVSEMREWISASEGLLSHVTLSPHWAESADLIRELRRLGIRVSIGHTEATPSQVHAAAEAGASMSTHLGNGAHAVLPRHPNYLWAQLSDDRLRIGLIADGHHLGKDVFRALVRAAGQARVHLVSDATALAGMPPGVYTTEIGGRVELTDDGALHQAGTPFLAGSARSLSDCITIAEGLGDLSRAAVLRLATENAAALLPARAGRRGSLTRGAAADIILFDPEGSDFRAETVFVGGVAVQSETGTGSGYRFEGPRWRDARQ